MQCIKEILENPLYSGIISGLIATFIFASLTWLWRRGTYWFYVSRKFHNKEFWVYWKRFTNDPPLQRVKCRVKRNVIEFTGYKPEDNNVEDYKGKFVMNPLNLKVGEGSYTHLDSDGFGFPKVVIGKDNAIFMDATYIAVNKNENGIKVGHPEYQAYIWKQKTTDK